MPTPAKAAACFVRRERPRSWLCAVCYGGGGVFHAAACLHHGAIDLNQAGVHRVAGCGQSPTLSAAFAALLPNITMPPIAAPYEPPSKETVDASPVTALRILPKAPTALNPAASYSLPKAALKLRAAASCCPCAGIWLPAFAWLYRQPR